VRPLHQRPVWVGGIEPPLSVWKTAKLRELGSNQRGTCLTDTRNYQQLPSRNEMHQTRIERALPAWRAGVLPLNDWCVWLRKLSKIKEVKVRIELTFPRYERGVLPLYDMTKVGLVGVEPTTSCLRGRCFAFQLQSRVPFQ